MKCEAVHFNRMALPKVSTTKLNYLKEMLTATVIFIDLETVFYICLTKKIYPKQLNLLWIDINYIFLFTGSPQLLTKSLKKELQS